MEASEPTPSGGVAAPELAELAFAPGPFATVYLRTESRIENAAQRSEVAWKTLRAQLEQAGAPDGALAAIDPVVPDAHLEGECLAAFASAEGRLHVEHGPEPPATDVGLWAPLPHLLTVLRWRQESPPHVMVLADRRGADLIGVRREAPDIAREAGGAEEGIRKVSPGGWSQKRYQQRAENAWEENAENVASELRALVERIGARAVVAAGDVRAIQLLRDELPSELAQIFHVVEGGRGADGSDESFRREVADLVSSTVVADTDHLLATFDEEVGQGDRAVQGTEGTARALSMAQVEVLLVAEDAADGRTAWFGPDPSHLALRAADLGALGVEEPVEESLVEVFIRAALGTGAAIRVVPSGGRPAEGVGAILRWPATPPG